jgi:hypothetical protein
MESHVVSHGKATGAELCEKSGVFLAALAKNSRIFLIKSCEKY